MLRQIWNSGLFFAVSIMFFTAILFSGVSSSDALMKGFTPLEEESNSIGNNGDNPLGIVIVPSEDPKVGDGNESNRGDNTPDYPDLGSDQVFPFIAGLDSFK